MSNWALNRIDVFDGASESLIGSIILPFPWGIDITPDGSTMYAATMLGDIYLIDPVALTVLHQSLVVRRQENANALAFI